MTRNLIELDKKYFIHPTSSIQQQQKDGAKVIFEKGNGIYLTDTEGNQFIDAMSSLWNVNIGYGRKDLADIAADQMKRLSFSSSFSTFSNEPAILLTEKIASLAPKGLNAVFLTSGGSESNDSAIKFARHYWRIQGKKKKRKILSRYRGYHGVSSASTSATGIPEFWDMAGFGEEEYVHSASPYRRTTSKTIQSMVEKIEEVGAENIAAFVAEPILGAGGVIIPDTDYLKEVRKICDKYNIIFIADEIICGFGRTGKMFGVENFDVVPDMITFAKGVTSGYIPLGGVIVSDAIHNMFKEKSYGTLMHGFTYSGHPTAAAVALKNIEIIEREDLVENSKNMGEKLLRGFQEIKSRLNYVGDVRAMGLLGAIELVNNPETNEPFRSDKNITAQVIEALHKRRVICRGVTYENSDIICFSPPLIINEKEINELIERVYDAIKEVEENIS